MARLPLNLPSASDARSTTSGSRVSTSSSSSAAWSPNKSRRVANELLQPPEVVPQLQRLPILSTLELHLLLQWHCQSCLQSGLWPPEVRRRRCTRKQPMSVRWILERALRDPHTSLLPDPLTWEQRRDTAHFVAHVYAHHSGETVRASRAMVRPLWESGSAAAKANFYLLSKHLGKPGPSCEAMSGRDAKGDRPVFGGLFTWQTPHGRKRDAICELRDLGLTVSEMAAELVANPGLKDEFANFTTWAKAMVSQAGFDVWSASMELNSVESDSNIVHLHLYIALRWDKFRTPEWEPITVVPANWIWRGFTPHFRPAGVRSNMNPGRIFFNGLYYLLAPKTGSIFRDGNREVFKDRGAAHSRVSALPKWPIDGRRPTSCLSDRSLRLLGGAILHGAAQHI